MGIFSIDQGHPVNCGAYGKMSETDGNRLVGNLLIAKLRTLGHTVYNCTYDININELGNRVRLANAQKTDYFISLHMDCFDNENANGVTIYTTKNSSAKNKAIEIINSVAESCGYNNRGWKSANFYVLKNTNSPAMLIEMGFVSSQVDCDKFNAEKIVNAIIKSLTGETSSTDSTIYKLGWNQNSTGWFYCTDVANGYYYKDTWKLINSEYFSFNNKGYAKQSEWELYKNQFYYLKDSCKMAKSEWVWWNDECYYLNKDGIMLTSCFSEDGYWLNSDGTWNKKLKGIN